MSLITHNIGNAVEMSRNTKQACANAYIQGTRYGIESLQQSLAIALIPYANENISTWALNKLIEKKTQELINAGLQERTGNPEHQQSNNDGQSVQSSS